MGAGRCVRCGSLSDLVETKKVLKLFYVPVKSWPSNTGPSLSFTNCGLLFPPSLSTTTTSSSHPEKEVTAANAGPEGHGERPTEPLEGRTVLPPIHEDGSRDPSHPEGGSLKGVVGQQVCQETMVPLSPSECLDNSTESFVPDSMKGGKCHLLSVPVNFVRRSEGNPDNRGVRLAVKGREDSIPAQGTSRRKAVDKSLDWSLCPLAYLVSKMLLFCTLVEVLKVQRLVGVPIWYFLMV
ncbi:hypothetical protein QJS10_CPA08g00724 [Acorus calamus]|uniref:Uncharacterized protein n=1 Tax=Acorus calamus TaxID=4465 RepID=A0AAV9ED85_ACOCL|nr:hypothetical protein QJS10_CPA08g00724 [Acorus calamus]